MVPVWFRARQAISFWWAGMVTGDRELLGSVAERSTSCTLPQRCAGNTIRWRSQLAWGVTCRSPKGLSQVSQENNLDGLLRNDITWICRRLTTKILSLRSLTASTGEGKVNSMTKRLLRSSQMSTVLSANFA
uniref:Putative secreted protein n=1 Tax=Ixodes ricinus TaxID=34613 RepID=A0A6B0URI1_IXORI